jgi:hypothetical protein
VKSTWHLAALAPLAERPHIPEGGVKLPLPLAVTVTVPVGLVAPVEEVSVTVTVQVATLPTTTDAGEQLTIVEVEWIDVWTW